MTAPPLTDGEFAAIAELVRARSGLWFAQSRRQQAEGSMRQAMDTAGIPDPERFLRLLRSNHRAFDALIERLVIGETYFFREREQFDALRRLVLPELRLQQSNREERLRVWSAGCATGEEAYSLAILLEQEGLSAQAEVLGTDISNAALALARKATYGAWSFRENPPGLIEQYFHRRGGKFTLIERIRQSVVFDHLNLAAEIPPARTTGPDGRFDLILCRNVLIYFDPPSIERTAVRMFGALKDGGWLIAGPSDPPLWPHAPFETVLTSAGLLYRRRGGTAASVKPSFTLNADLPRPAIVVATAAPARPIAAPSGATAPQGECSVRATPPIAETAKVCAARLRAMVDRDNLQQSVAAMAAALAAHPLSAELYYLHAILLLSGDRHDEAAVALRRAIYLDRSLVVAHFALASIQQRRGAMAEARRCYRNVLAVCDRGDADDIVPLTDGEQAGRLAEAARVQLALIQAGAGDGR